ncbi:MAG TPA: hypothetical protein VNT03_09705 [Baekduia sp.]|nr:hypothetical protein [Baekduia sp.]
MSGTIYAGVGMEVVYELRTCTKCGTPRSVVAARVADGELRDGSRRGRCLECGSQSLAPLHGHETGDEVDPVDVVLPCPRCQGPTHWLSVGLWD